MSSSSYSGRAESVVQMGGGMRESTLASAYSVFTGTLTGPLGSSSTMYRGGAGFVGLTLASGAPFSRTW